MDQTTPWYVVCDEEMANKILSRCKPNNNGQTIFLIRPNSDDTFALAVNYKSTIGERLISLHKASKKVSLVAASEKFNSLKELVDFYKTHELDAGGALKGKRFKLDIAVRDQVPKNVLSEAVALYDLKPMYIYPDGQDMPLVRGQKYWIVSKDGPNEWWTIYNSDALVGTVPSSFLLEILKHK